MTTMRQKTVSPTKPRRRSEKQSAAWYGVIKFLLQLIARFYVRKFRVYGTDNIPATGAAFLVANHTSGVDPLLLGLAAPHRMLMGPGKVQIFINPVFAYVMQKIGIFPLQQGVADANAVRSMVEAYRSGRIVVVYPEGGRSKTGEMIPFVEDFTRLVIRLKAPIIPAGIAGATDLLPLHSWLPRPNTACAVVVGRTLDLSAYHDRPLNQELLTEATAVLWNRIHELAQEAEAHRKEIDGP